MPAVKTYTRVNFQNYPSTSTPLNATNLNKMDKGIDDLDDEVVTVKNAIENMSFDADSISYDNTSSGLQATDVQDAVDEINDNLTDGIGGTTDKFRFGTDGNGNYGYIKKVEGADTFFPFKSDFNDLYFSYQRLSDGNVGTVVMIPKTSNTQVSSEILPTVYQDNPTYTFTPIANDVYFYVIKGSYNDGSAATPVSLSQVSVTNGTVSRLGGGSGLNYSSYALFRVKGNSNTRVTIPKSAYTVQIKLVQFTV